MPHANEIHIDAKYYGTPIGEQIITHEKKHFIYALQLAEMHSRLKRIYITMKSNLWDLCDVYRVMFKEFLEKLKNKKGAKA